VNGIEMDPLIGTQLRNARVALKSDSQIERGQTLSACPLSSRLHIFTRCGLCSQILNVDVCAEPDVIGKIPSNVVGIVIDDYVIRTPQPSIAEGYVERCNIPVPAIEPEAAGGATSEMPNVSASKASCKVAVREGMVQMVVCIIATGVVANPGLAINVRRAGMTGPIAVVRLGVGELWRAFVGFRSTPWNRLMWLSRVLREYWNGKNEQCCKCQLNGFHDVLLMPGDCSYSLPFSPVSHNQQQ